VRKGTAEVRDVQNICRTFWSIQRARSSAAPIGKKPSHALLVGVILHVLYAEERKTLTRGPKSSRSRAIL